MATKRSHQSDVTAYARIRNTALRLFAERGAAVSTIREVADAAGVSIGLIQHHFTTKADLQAAVEAYVSDKVAELATGSLKELTQSGQLVIGKLLVEFIRENPDLIRYGRRALLEDDALGRRLFDQIVFACRLYMDRLEKAGVLRPTIDMDWAILNAVLLILGPVLLESGINRHLDRPYRSNDGLARWETASDDLLCHGVYRAGAEISPNVLLAVGKNDKISHKVRAKTPPKPTRKHKRS